jgi:hypothetical protein
MRQRPLDLSRRDRISDEDPSVHTSINDHYSVLPAKYWNVELALVNSFQQGRQATNGLWYTERRTQKWVGSFGRRQSIRGFIAEGPRSGVSSDKRERNSCRA